jgi:hypothetical protein
MMYFIIAYALVLIVSMAITVIIEYFLPEEDNRY